MIACRKTQNNQGVFQGSPMSAFLFIMYDGEMTEDYENDLKQETRENMNNTIVRNETKETNDHHIYI